MRTATSITITASCLLSAACARTPDVQIGYYLPRSSVAVKAVRTVGCDTNGTIHSATAVTSTTVYGPDSKEGLQPVRFRSLDGTLANSDLALTFTEDGRLKGVNATTVGKGEEVLKSAIQMASMVLGGGFAFLRSGDAVPASQPTPCDLIRTFGGKERMVTLNYAAGEKFDLDVPKANPLPLQQGSPKFAQDIDAALTPLCFAVGMAIKDIPPVSVGEGEDARAAVKLHLRQPAKVPVSVSEGVGGICNPALAMAETTKKYWNGTILVPQLGKPYWLPIPRGALFGKQSFVMALADSGAITTLQYGKESGASGMMNVVNAGLMEAKPDSAATRAAELKAEADLIAQQQRLIGCQMDPENCK